MNSQTNARYGTLTYGRFEERGIAAARFARTVVPPGSVVVRGNHSGTLRYYGGIMTLNYPWLLPAALDPAVEWLRARGVRLGEFGSRYGAEGEGPSQYLFDPEGNMVELKGPPDVPLTGPGDAG